MPSGEDSLEMAVSEYGRRVSRRLNAFPIQGSPEEQLRSPLEALVRVIAVQCRLDPDKVVLIPETRVPHLKTRPDFAVLYRGALVGFIELKAPGKGADPRRFRDRHDKDQWEEAQRAAQRPLHRRPGVLAVAAPV